MRKRNCWEKKGCGRMRGGDRVDLGPCPASTCAAATGINGGLYAGRSCWAIEHTLGADKVPESFAEKFGCCLACPFYLQVMAEEGRSYQGIREIRRKLEGYQLF